MEERVFDIERRDGFKKLSSEELNNKQFRHGLEIGDTLTNFTAILTNEMNGKLYLECKLNGYDFKVSLYRVISQLNISFVNGTHILDYLKNKQLMVIRQEVKKINLPDGHTMDIQVPVFKVSAIPMA